MNSLYDPAVKALMFGDYPAILGMHDLDKSAIYGKNLFKWKVAWIEKS